MTFLQKHKKALKIPIFAYIVFAGCFAFPIRSEKFPLDFMKLYVLFASYGIIGASLAELYGAKKGRFVYIATLVFTIIGLACRYFLEFGEVSNTYNFTLFNILSYLVLIPAGTLIAYFISLKSTERKENSP